MTSTLEHKYISTLCIGLGLCNRDIADRLHVRPHTVANNLSLIYRKYGLRGRNSRIRLAMMVIRGGRL